MQSGDPSGTGSGGQENIYDGLGGEEDERLDGKWARLLGREVGERIMLGDELHGRLRFGRRGLVGMAKGEGGGPGGGGYGSQFFITLGDARAELDGKCTMFGRVEGEGIYNVVKIAEGELAGERPGFPERILRVEVTQMPGGEAWEGMRKRVRVEARVVEESSRRKEKGGGGGGGKKKAKKGLLSFADEEGEGDVAMKPRKAKFNTALIASDGMDVEEISKLKINGHVQSERPADGPPPAKRRKPSVSPPRREKLLASMTAHPSSPASKSPDAPPRRKPSFHEPTTQLPLRNEEIPSRSETSSPLPASSAAAGPSKSKSSLESEIAALKASMRRDTAPAPAKKKLSALEAMIPATSTRGRKRPRPGETGQREDKHALEMLNAFKARLDSVKDVDIDVDVDGPVGGHGDRDKGKGKSSSSTVAAESKRLNGLKITSPDAANTKNDTANEEDDEETPLCDLHFIANCQSCSKWDSDLLDPLSSSSFPSSKKDNDKDDDQDTDKDWMSHRLAFGRDQLGKDLNFKKRREALEELVVIDPREKAGQILAKEREKQRVRKEGVKRGRR